VRRNFRNLSIYWAAALGLAISADAVAKPVKAKAERASPPAYVESSLDEDLAPAAAAAAKASAASPLVTIGPIDGESDAKMTVINIRFDRKPAWKTLGEFQDHGSFLQLTLPDTLVPESGKFYDGGNPYLPKIAVIQLTPSDAGVRLFVSKEATKIKQALTAALLGNRIVVTVDHAKLATLVAAEAVKTHVTPPDFVGPPGPDAAAEIIARTEVRRDIPAPSDLFKQEKSGKAEAPLATGGFDLRGRLVHLAMFGGAMLVLLVASWLARPYIQRRRATGQDQESGAPITMKTLSTLALASRQKISLIQVGDEKILIGVTPDAVTFLTAIGKTAPARMASGFAELTAQPAPNFSRLLTERPAPAMDLKSAPVLKKMPGNDPESLRDSPSRPLPTRPIPGRDGAARPPSSAAKPAPSTKPMPSSQGAQPKPKRPAGTRINVTVGEDGVQDLGAAAPRARQAATEGKPAGAPLAVDGQKAIDDVTRLIREKLKTLRTI